jgi:hypothetical protein
MNINMYSVPKTCTHIDIHLRYTYMVKFTFMVMFLYM